MPRKVRELLGDLKAAGFTEVTGGKGSHRKLVHARYAGSVILSGGLRDDAKPFRNGNSSAFWRHSMRPNDRYFKWVAWSEEDQTYLGYCPDLITPIHGDDPVQLYDELCTVIDEVIAHFESISKPLPPARTRPMQEVAV